MTEQPLRVIFGDWGTSVCRLYLCRRDASGITVEDRCKGPGIKHSQDHEAAFFELCQPWLNAHGKLPVYLIGTVGADIGWHQAPYVPCPAEAEQFNQHAVSFVSRDIEFVIFPGLSCLNRHDLPDIMRGEETQIFGFLHQSDALAKEQLICLPGTHTKWALIKGETIASFITSPIGELFEVLSHHSVLLSPLEQKQWCQDSFDTGLDVGLALTSNLLHTLFATRAFQVLENKSNVVAASYLSGLLIGADVKAAMQDFHLFSHVTLIGSDNINRLYTEALEKMSINCSQMSSEMATVSGLQRLAGERMNKQMGNL